MRLVDLVISGLGLLFLSPFFLLIAFVIKLTTEGPVFYRGTRIGRDRRLFDVYKFRSMVANADQMGKGITSAGDPRITGIGKVLRRYKLDELPQLINVFKGEMSLVGPRPEVPRYINALALSRTWTLRSNSLVFAPGKSCTRSSLQKRKGSLGQRTLRSSS